VWANDKGSDDGVQDPDFLAVIDANPTSATYGKVVNTVALACIPGANLLDEIGLAPGTSSCLLNEAHHITEAPYVDPATGHTFLFVGSLISANIFFADSGLYRPGRPSMTRHRARGHMTRASSTGAHCVTDMMSACVRWDAVYGNPRCHHGP
jgi:hypothetical protein